MRNQHVREQGLCNLIALKIAVIEDKLDRAAWMLGVYTLIVNVERYLPAMTNSIPETNVRTFLRRS